MKLVYGAMPYSHPDREVVAARMEVFYKVTTANLKVPVMFIRPEE